MYLLSILQQSSSYISKRGVEHKFSGGVSTSSPVKTFPGTPHVYVFVHIFVYCYTSKRGKFSWLSGVCLVLLRRSLGRPCSASEFFIQPSGSPEVCLHIYAHSQMHLIAQNCDLQTNSLILQNCSEVYLTFCNVRLEGKR